MTTYTMAHITDLAAWPAEMVAQFAQEIPALVASLRLVAQEAAQEKTLAGVGLADLVPSVTYDPASGGQTPICAANGGSSAVLESVRASETDGGVQAPLTSAEVRELAVTHGATDIDAGVYQFREDELLAFAHAVAARPVANNWTLITQEAQPFYDEILRVKDGFLGAGERYRLIGVMDAADDYYYVVRHIASGKQKLLSCVGNLESWGFELGAG